MKTTVTTYNHHSLRQSRSLPLFLILFLFFQTTSPLTRSSFKPAVHQQVSLEQIETSHCTGLFSGFFSASLKTSDRNTSTSDALFSTEYHRSFLQQQHTHLSKMRLSPCQDNVLTFRDKRQASFHSRRTVSALSETPSDFRSA